MTANQMMIALFISVGLLIGMMVLQEVGRRIGVKQLNADPDGAKVGTGSVEGSIFALLGLLIAFTFTGAAARFEMRRDLIIEEANAIGTAYLRLDLLPVATQAGLRERFRQYVDARVSSYENLPDVQAALAEHQRAMALQGEIWTRSLEAAQTEGALSQAMMLLIPALNEMIDITSTRTMALRQHPPPVIFGMLVVLGLASALLAGYGMAGGKSRSWLHITVFSAVLGLSVYVILDIEYPRLGLISVDSFDSALVDLRESMN